MPRNLTPSWIDKQVFSTPPSIASGYWTVLSGGNTPIVTDFGDRIRYQTFMHPTLNTRGYNAITAPCPTPPYKVTAAFMMTATAPLYYVHSMGLVLLSDNSASPQITAFNYGISGGLNTYQIQSGTRIGRYSSPTALTGYGAFSDSESDFVGWTGTDYMWFRIRDDNTNIYFDSSVNGIYWFNKASTSRTAVFSSGSSAPARIGMGSEAIYVTSVTPSAVPYAPAVEYTCVSYAVELNANA